MTSKGARPKLIVGIGELLWDLLPAGAQLGGAVSNFSVMAARLGDHAVCASRLGADDLGRQARERLSQSPVDTSFLEVDRRRPTGAVSVALKCGQPEYRIHWPAAWDFLQLTKEWLDLARRADAVCFGSLAQRSPVSFYAIQGFLAATSPQCVRVFDVNLRRPYYSAGAIESSLRRATVLKMNDAEMPLVLDLLGLPHESSGKKAEEAMLAGARRLLGRFPIELVCVTMGHAGSLLATRAESDRHPGIATAIVDTVGAGDAFAAALTHFYLRREPLAVINEAGNRWGAWAASQPGGMPQLDAATHKAISSAISDAIRRRRDKKPGSR